MSAKSDFQKREAMTVADRQRGVYLTPLRRKLATLAPDEMYGVMVRLVMDLPIKLRRSLYLALAHNLRRGGQ